MRQVRIAPDISYNWEYNTAENSTTKAIGAYSLLPLCFGGLVLTCPAVVLGSNSYDTLIGTKFLRDFRAEISYSSNKMTVLGYAVPLIFDNDAPNLTASNQKKKVRKVNIAYTNSIVPINYQLYGKHVPLPPTTMEADDGILIYAPFNTHLDPSSQCILPTGVKYDVPTHLYMVAESTPNLHHSEPRLCSS